LQTRAIRRRHSTFEASRKTLKQTKKDIHFPKAIYAIKA
jgi:large subunit ribosomal protein L35e